MKKTLLSASLVLGLAASAFAQGQVALNIFNTSASSTATSNGLLWQQVGANAPTLLTLDNFDNPTTDAPVFVTLLGGSSPTDLAVLNRVGGGTAAAALVDYNYTPGQYGDDIGSAYIVAGVASGGTAYFELEVWAGNVGSLSAAQAAGDFNGTSAIWSQAIGGGTATPPNLTGMPSVILTVPEPGTFALAGLGAAALLIFRRRK